MYWILCSSLFFAIWMCAELHFLYTSLAKNHNRCHIWWSVQVILGSYMAQLQIGWDFWIRLLNCMLLPLWSKSYILPFGALSRASSCIFRGSLVIKLDRNDVWYFRTPVTGRRRSKYDWVHLDLYIIWYTYIYILGKQLYPSPIQHIFQHNIHPPLVGELIDWQTFLSSKHGSNSSQRFSPLDMLHRHVLSSDTATIWKVARSCAVCNGPRFVFEKL